VAEYAVTEGGTLSTSGLGSCVAVAIYEPDGPGGLLHAMLPYADTVPGACAAKCVDTGVRALRDELLAAGADEAELVAKLVGGSAMLDLTGPAIGDRNVVAARETLAAHSIPVHAEDVGGKRGRSIHLSLSTGDLRVRSGDTVDIL
jgi:chemotaxis protein CheD